MLYVFQEPGSRKVIYSRSSEYAIRASLYLGTVAEGKCAMAKEIAETEKIPVHFLAKILQQLARKGLLRSQKGPSGGFCLRKAAKDVRLIDIVDAVDGLGHYAQCIVGLPECNDRMGCPMHDSWITLHGRIMDYLRRNTVGSLVKQMETNRAALQVAKAVRESKKVLRPSVLKERNI